MPPAPGYRHGFRRPAIRAAMRAGAASVAEIAAQVGLARRTVAAHLERMRADGEVRRVEHGRGNVGARWALLLQYHWRRSTTDALAVASGHSERGGA
jgi:predicted ArsR family transcriptional regulator